MKVSGEIIVLYQSEKVIIEFYDGVINVLRWKDGMITQFVLDGSYICKYNKNIYKNDYKKLNRLYAMKRAIKLAIAIEKEL